MLSINIIKQTVEPLAKKYDLKIVDLFGSYANGTATEKSDADFLVEFNTRVPSIFKVMGFKEELSKCLNNPVDVISLPAPRLESLNIEKTVRIYERA